MSDQDFRDTMNVIVSMVIESVHWRDEAKGDPDYAAREVHVTPAIEAFRAVLKQYVNKEV